MDANSKLGTKYIPNAPHAMSPKGKILSEIIERHALVVANGSRKCSGLITRKRSTTTRTEKSCIDLLIFSDDLRNEFKSLLVDEDRKYVLTRITNTKRVFLHDDGKFVIYFSTKNHVIGIFFQSLNDFFLFTNKQ